MKYKFAIVPFPFDDLSAVKPRPVICLTDKIGSHNHIVVAFVTSQISKATETTDLKILSTDSEFYKTGLRQNSAIRLHRLFSISENMIDYVFGELPTAYQKDLENKLKDLFELN